MSDCEKHPLEETAACARCGKAACASCGVFYIDEQLACRACGDELVEDAGLPLGTLLIATLYLSMVATLAATGRLKPAFLGGAALLAIVLARLFAVNRELRRPLVTKLVATDEARGNARVSGITRSPRAPAVAQSVALPTAKPTSESLEAANQHAEPADVQGKKEEESP